MKAIILAMLILFAGCITEPEPWHGTLGVRAEYVGFRGRTIYIGLRNIMLVRTDAIAHPRFGWTDADGLALFSGLPAGDYSAHLPGRGKMMLVCDPAEGSLVRGATKIPVITLTCELGL